MLLFDQLTFPRVLLIIAALIAPLCAPCAWATCTAANPNAHIIEATPTADFDTATAAGTVIHKKTGLMWQRCALGQIWNGTTCAGTALAYTWANALIAAKNSNLAGYSDWRLPNRAELESIVETCGWKPAINQEIFPMTPAYDFLSASSIVVNPDVAWSVDFFIGFNEGAAAKLGILYVRLVRGGNATDSFDLLSNSGIPTYVIATAANPAASGTVSCTPNPVSSGGSSTCTATANTRYTFTGWSGDCTGTGACVLSNITSAKSVTANFTINPINTVYSIITTAKPAAGGTVSCTPNPVSSGGGSTCMATANTGYVFKRWGGDCTGSDACVLNNVTSAKNVTAKFKRQKKH